MRQSRSLPTATVIQRSLALNVSYGQMGGWRLPIRAGETPVMKKIPAWKVRSESCASNIATSTSCPRPVRSRA